MKGTGAAIGDKREVARVAAPLGRGPSLTARTTFASAIRTARAASAGTLIVNVPASAAKARAAAAASIVMRPSRKAAGRMVPSTT